MNTKTGFFAALLLGSAWVQPAFSEEEAPRVPAPWELDDPLLPAAAPIAAAHAAMIAGESRDFLEAVAAIQPYHALVRYEGRTAAIAGGNLGLLPRPDAAEFVRIAAALTAITQFTGAEIFQVAEATSPNAGGHQMRLQQLVDGIPVRANNTVLADRSGKILQLATSLVPSDFVPIRPVLSRAQAWDRVVLRGQAQESRKLAADTASLRVELLYLPVTSMDDLHLFYEFWFTDLPHSYFARVSAVDGTTKLTRLEWQ